MADKKEIAAFRSRVDAVFHATADTRAEMLRHRALYEGELWKSDEPEFSGFGKSTVQFNLPFSTVSAIAPLVTSNRPIASVTPKDPHLQKLTETLNDVTKYAWQALDMHRKTYLWVVDAKVCKYGVAKVGYNPEKRFGGPYDFTILDPADFFIAPGYDDPWEAPWCGVRAKKPESWITANFPNAKLKSGKDGETDARAFKYSGASPGEDGTGFTEVTELWLRDDEAIELVTRDDDGKKVKTKQQKYPYGRLVWFTDKELLGNEACKDEHGLPPYVVLYNYERPHSFTGISDVELIEGIHKDVNLILKFYSEHFRKYHDENELIDVTGGFDVETYKRERTKGGQVFSYDSRGGALKPPVTTISEPEPNSMMHSLMSFLLTAAEEVTSVTDLIKGQVGKQERQSARELGILKEAGESRPMQQSVNLEWSLGRVYYLFLRNVMQYQTKPEYFSWTETEGPVYTQYGNSFAQADRIMRPPESPELSQLVEQQKTRPSTDPETKAVLAEYEREVRDYKEFLRLFQRNGGELDPVFFPFTIEIQADSMLPKDRQSRANMMIRLLQLAPEPARPAMFELVIKYLQLPGGSEVTKEMRELMEKMQTAGQAAGPQEDRNV